MKPLSRGVYFSVPPTSGGGGQKYEISLALGKKNEEKMKRVKERGKEENGREKGREKWEDGREEEREKGKSEGKWGRGEKGRGKGKGGIGKRKGGREKEKGVRGKGKGPRGEGKKTQKSLKKTIIRNALNKIRGDLEVYLFRAPKRSVILLKSKDGALSPLHPPPPLQTSSKFARASETWKIYLF